MKITAIDDHQPESPPPIQFGVSGFFLYLGEMPRVLRTVLPRIRKSFCERGLLVSLCRSALLPLHVFREYRQARRLEPGKQAPSGFDREYGVDTEGDFEGWTYLSDLDIPSPNWIHGNNYAPIEPARFHAILASLDIRFEDFVFIDFGSGKGRALLMASQFPFKKIVGIEFSPQLHAIALTNLAKDAAGRRDTMESLCLDFLEFPLPPEPSVLFFFDPCDESVLSKMLQKISQSLAAAPRELYVIYVAPNESKQQLFATEGCLRRAFKNVEQNFCVYRASPGSSLEGLS